MPKPNRSRIDRQKKPDSPPRQFQGARDAQVDTTDGITVGHEEAEAQRRRGDVVPAAHGNAAGGGRPKPPRAGA